MHHLRRDFLNIRISIDQRPIALGVRKCMFRNVMS